MRMFPSFPGRWYLPRLTLLASIFYPTKGLRQHARYDAGAQLRSIRYRDHLLLVPCR